MARGEPTLVENAVRYALAPGGGVAEPHTAPRLERHYRCFDCREFVHVRRGPVRTPHFAHYAERKQPCNAETIAHEAAKHRLANLLASKQVSALHLLIGCPGFIDTYNHPVPCPDEGTTARTLPIPAFDAAGVEVPFHRYRLDAAASRSNVVVLGLEVYHSHYVDEDKRAFLMKSGLPWIELAAEAVLEQEMPWPVIRSSYGVTQCAACAERNAAAAAERRRRELEAQRQAEENAQRLAAEKARRELEARTVPIARQGNQLVLGRGRDVGKTFTCLVCAEPVTAEKVNGGMVFLHAPNKTCDARRVWVRAGMLAVYRQLKRDPGQVRLVRRCSGTFDSWSACKKLIYDRLPDFDEVRGEEPSLILLKDDKPLVQLVFGRNPELVGAQAVLELRPGKIVHKPALFWQHKDGRRCQTCERHYSETQARLQARQRTEAERREREFQEMRRILEEREKKRSQERLRARLKERNQDPQQTAKAATFAKDYFAALGVPLERAAEMGVVVRPCESCGKYGAFLILSNIATIPEGLEAVVAPHKGLVSTLLRNRCARCGTLVSSAHNMFAQDDELFYLVYEDLRNSG